MKISEDSRTEQANVLNINNKSNVASKKKKYPKAIKGCISVEEYIDILRENVRKHYKDLQSTDQKRSVV